MNGDASPAGTRGARDALPPGPRAPAAWQTVEWIARPTALLRRCAARHGDAFTLRTHWWADAPMVLVSDPASIRTIFTAPAEQARAGQSATFLEPFAGASSILLLDGERHLRQRRLMLPPFHGDRLERHRATVARLAREEADRWRPGTPVATLRRMQQLTLEVILRAVFGEEDPARRAALRAGIRRALDLTRSTPRLVGMSLVQRDLGPRSPWGAFYRAVRALDGLLYDLIARRRAAGGGGAILDLLLRARDEHGAEPTDSELRDQLVTLLAAGHETTAGALAWAFERLARHPEAAAQASDDRYLDATVKEVLRTRPVLSIAPRKLLEPLRLAGHDVPAGVHVAACIYLAHRRREAFGPDPLAFRPGRWLDGEAPPPYAYLPFGGGVRRCLGAAFATMELTEVLREIVPRLRLGPDRPRTERMRRRSVTLTPERGGRILVA